ncbi:hypothetical protein FRB99_008727 [Tulasnella sp. 403]|nr:hypothetical protein FRB99_008727 [Tulasnella sp. 403]
MRLAFTIGVAVASLSLVKAQAPTSTANIADERCKRNQFYYPALDVCLPVGGPPNPSKEKDCPDDCYPCALLENGTASPTPYAKSAVMGHSPPGSLAAANASKNTQAAFSLLGTHWDYKYKKCVDDDPIVPLCGPGFVWSPRLKECIPVLGPPTPSGGIKHKKKELKRGVSDWECPAGFISCPIPGSRLTKCIDPENDAAFCGGCPTTGEGQNCMKIPGTRRGFCDAGSCRVSVCEKFHKRSNDRTRCIPF